MNKINGRMNQEQIEKLIARHDSYAVANQNQVQVIKGARRHIEKLEGDNRQLSAELSASRISLELLTEKMSTKYDAGNREVKRLHALLEEHGIDPGG